VSTDIREGVVYRANGVTVTAFLVDHGPVAPAFGYRVDYQHRSVVMSGDTRPSENLIKYAKGADLLIHEAGLWKQDPRLVGPADEPFPTPTSRGTRGQARTIAEHHTDASEAGRIFERVKPRLAVFSHYNVAAPILPLVRQSYSGAVEVGEDGMTIDIGEAINIRKLTQK
jgi:ribonuclease Z